MPEPQLRPRLVVVFIPDFDVDPDDRVLRLSYLVYFETAFSSARAWSIWSYAYVTTAAVVIVSPLRASDS